jgi:hypothetical protein
MPENPERRIEHVYDLLPDGTRRERDIVVEYPAEGSWHSDLSVKPEPPRAGPPPTNRQGIRLLQVGDVFAHFGAEWLVERTGMSGGGHQSSMSGGYEFYPDEYCVWAVRLTPTREYDPDGDRIRFYQDTLMNSTLFTRTPPRLVGRMRQGWTWEEA